MLQNIIQKNVDIQNEMMNYFTNKEVPLEKRWQEFNNLPDSLKKVSDGLELKVDDNLLSDMSLRKGDVLSLSMFLENIEIMKEEVLNAEERALDYSSRAWLKKVNIDSLYEEVLSKGYHSFVNNW